MKNSVFCLYLEILKDNLSSQLEEKTFLLMTCSKKCGNKLRCRRTPNIFYRN